jgi:hypothetical protein
MTIAQQLKIKEFPFTIKDSKGNEIYFEFNGFWSKREYDTNGKQIYYEDSDGYIKDNRPKTDVEKALELLEKEGYQIFKYI